MNNELQPPPPFQVTLPPGGAVQSIIKPEDGKYIAGYSVVDGIGHETQFIPMEEVINPDSPEAVRRAIAKLQMTMAGRLKIIRAAAE